MSSIMPCKTTRAKTKVDKKDDTMPVEPSDSISAIVPKMCPKPQPMGAAAATDANAVPELGRRPPTTLAKASENRKPLKMTRKQGTTIKETPQIPAPLANDCGDPVNGVPPTCSRPVRIHKPTAATAIALEASIPKQPSKKALAVKAKVQKEEARQKSIQALAIYKMKIKAMGFEETPLPPPPHAAAAATTASGLKKIPGILRDLDVIMMNVSGMEVDDDDGGIEDLIAEVHDSESNEEEMLWPGFK